MTVNVCLDEMGFSTKPDRKELRIMMNEKSIQLFTHLQFTDGGCEDCLDVSAAVMSVFDADGLLLLNGIPCIGPLNIKQM